jgi:hypothetical protein
MSDKMSRVRANSAWHIENLIEHNPECQVVELCVAEQLEEKCDILTNRVKVLEEALQRVLRVSRGTSGRIILEAEDELEARKALEADNG